MWVWRSLGFDTVVELPNKALSALGRRCRCANDESKSFDTVKPPEDILPGPLSRLKDDFGTDLELYPVGLLSGGMDARTYRLAKPEGSRVSKLRLCIPGAVELKAAPHETFEVLEIKGNSCVAVSTLKEAISELVEVGGGVFNWSVPMVDARLRQDISEECSHTPAPEAFPLCVVGAVLGASLEIAVTLPSRPSTSSPKADRRLGSPLADHSPTGSRAVPSESMSWVPCEMAFHGVPPVPCDGFQIQFIQHGGPPLDPRRLSKTTTEEKPGSRTEAVSMLAEELERWVAKNLATRPDTWCALHVVSQEVDPKVLVRGFDVPALPAAGAATRRLTGDVVLAVSADTEVALEPFELSYGDAHTASLRKMLEDEVAQALDIEEERVICGEFMPLPRIRGNARKPHMRRDTIGLRFALLHPELMELVRVQKPAKRAAMLADNGKLPSEVARPPSRAQVEAASGMASSTLKRSGMSKKVGRGRAHMKASSSAPVLPKRILMTSSTHLSEEPNGSRDKTPPDLLLKRLRSTLTEAKHPVRRRPDAFPMLSRVVGGLRSGALLVVNRSDLVHDNVSEGLKQLMRARTVVKRELESGAAMRNNLNEIRADVLKMYKEPIGMVVDKQRQLTGLSAKELLDEMEASVSRPADLHAALRMLLEHTQTDVEWCLRLRSHRAVERVLALARRFNSERAVVCRGVGIISNLTLNDPGCVDKLLEKLLAPDFILALENFPQDQDIQFRGCQTLRRLYLRAREVASHGPRVVCLGKNISEVWTFKGLDRILATMRLFSSNAEVQIECLTLLTSLGELLTNNGKAEEMFTILEAVMRRHNDRPDILAKSVLMIARLGPVFLTYEHRGVFNIVQAMARHRSDVELQRVATRALVSLARDAKALVSIRSGGSVSAVMMAMGAHSKDEQVLREGAKALEKLCPVGIHEVSRICGDLAAMMPRISWQNSTPSAAFEGATLDDKWEPGLVKMFREDIALARPRRPGKVVASQTGDDDDDDHESAGLTGSGLTTIRGFRRSGFREELDAMDSNWACSLSVQSQSEAREKDIKVLQGRGCNADRLKSPGPSIGMLKGLCDSFSNGLNKDFGPQDGELFATLIGHLAWCSMVSANELIAAGAAKICAAWLDEDRFRKSHPPEVLGLAVPMHRACLGALSSLCLHSEDLANKVLAVDAPRLLLRFMNHTDQRTQQVALRLLARILPVSAVQVDSGIDEIVPRDIAWRFILRELKERDDLRLLDVLRTCAGACALEAVQVGWISAEVSEGAGSQDMSKRVHELGEGLLIALQKSVKYRSASSALPLLLTVWRMLSSPEVEDGHAAIKALLVPPRQGDESNTESGRSIVQLLAFWLPRAVALGPPMPTRADRGAAVAAARALEAFCEYQAPLPFREMRELLVTGQSTIAEPVLREACKGALLKSVEKEDQPQQLAHLFVTSVGKGRDQDERLAEPTILRSIAERTLRRLKEQPSLYTDVIQNSLNRARSLLPKESQDPDELAVLGLLSRIETCTEDGASGSGGTDSEAANHEDDEDRQSDPDSPELTMTAPSHMLVEDMGLQGTPRDFSMTSPAVFSVG